MRKVLIGTIIGLGLILMCFTFMWKLLDSAEPMRHKSIRRKRYVKVKPENYN